MPNFGVFAGYKKIDIRTLEKLHLFCSIKGIKGTPDAPISLQATVAVTNAVPHLKRGRHPLALAHYENVHYGHIGFLKQMKGFNHLKLTYLDGKWQERK